MAARTAAVATRRTMRQGKTRHTAAVDDDGDKDDPTARRRAGHPDKWQRTATREGGNTSCNLGQVLPLCLRRGCTTFQRNENAGVAPAPAGWPHCASTERKRRVLENVGGSDIWRDRQ